ncbi:MAG: DUF1570 domain-containing protein [Planctomycetota bacterium]
MKQGTARRTIAAWAPLVVACAGVLPAAGWAGARARPAPPARAAPAMEAADDEAVPRGPWSPSRVPDGWVVEETRHYQVQCQSGKDVARELARHMEDMLSLYREFVATTRLPDGFVVKVFADRAALIAYCKAHDIEASGAFFDRDAGEMLAWNTGIVLGRRQIPTGVHLDPDRSITLPHHDMQRVLQLLDEATAAYTPDTAALLSHEGWHQYFHAWMVSWVPTPAWLEEGIGDWFATAVRDESGRYRPGRIHDGRLRDLHRALEEGTTVHTESLMRFNTSEYYERDQVYYAQGWSLVQFLMQHREGAWRGIIPRLLKEFRDTKNFPGSTRLVLEDIDLDRLHEEWLDWVLDQKPVDPLRDLAHEYGAKITPAQLVAEDELKRLYDWHLRHPDAPNRAKSRLR